MLRSKYFTPAIHVFIWLTLLVVPVVLFRNVKFDTGLPRHFFLLSNLYHIALFYFNAYWLYPKFFNRKRWWLYFILMLVLIFASAQGKLLIIRMLDVNFVLNEANRAIIMFPTIPFLASSFIFRVIADRVRFEKMEKERTAERLNSELKFLRSQVSPHFLFNVLTNMVSLARKKSDQLEPALIQLSDLLRYMLYETSNEKFPLTKEIEYLKNYIELQQLRFGDDVSVKVDIQDNKEDCAIEPMLLIPFVENAFKHGIGVVHEPFIDISLKVLNGRLRFQVANKYSSNNTSKDRNSGIGLANVKNRLDLLYKNRHNLSIKDDGEFYSVELNLDLQC